MKFKNLRTKLKEAHAQIAQSDIAPSVGIGPSVSGVDYNLNIGALTGVSLDALNAFLGSVAEKTYIDTTPVMNHMQTKLRTVGLHFEYRSPAARTGVSPLKKTNSDTDAAGPIDLTKQGAYKFPLSYMGGAYGRLPTDAGYEPQYTDNIAEKIGYSLDLCVCITKNANGTSSMTAKIEKAVR